MFPKQIIQALFLLCCASPSTWAENACAEIESAFAAGDLAALEAMGELKDPYWQAFLRYRIASMSLQLENRPLAREHLVIGLEAINTYRDQHPDDPEGLILAAMLNGQRFISRRVPNFFAGWRAYRLMNRARKIAPDNPRLALMRGVGIFLAPVLLGGNAEEARAELTVGLNGLNHPPCVEGEWAETDLRMWLGRVYRQLDQNDKSAGEFAHALQLSPGNVWVIAARDGTGYVWNEDEAEAP